MLINDLSLEEDNINNVLTNKKQKKVILMSFIIVFLILCIISYIIYRLFIFFIFLIICIIVFIPFLIFLKKSIKAEKELKKINKIKKDKLKKEKLKKELFERQKNMRKNNNDNYDNNDIMSNEIIIEEVEEKEKKEEKKENMKINAVLEDMCIYGNIMKEEIQKEKEENPEKFIETKDALKLEQENQDLFALGLLSQNLEDEGIETVIEKENNDEDELDAGTTCLQFITSGLYKKTKYDLHFDLGEERNEEILNNEKEYEKFKNDLKLKLSKDYNIPIDKIIVTFPQKGSLHVQVIFQSDEFNNLNKNDFINKFKNDEEFKELQNLKEIHSDIIMNVFKFGWGINEQRGNKPYDPPIGWIGIGLNVYDRYDDGDPTWIGMNNSKGEWCVAYHGVGRGQESSKVKNITGLIYGGGFKPGSEQWHKDCEDIYHPGQKVKEGVYCTPHIKTAESYSGISNINGKNYKTVLMVRVKPDKIRGCKDSGDYWVVSGTPEDIRPYRILYKCC